jgi:hypothetical protein
LPSLAHFKIGKNIDTKGKRAKEEEKDPLAGITIESASYFHLVSVAKPVAQWTVDEVFEWAKTIVAEKHARILKVQEVDGQVLLALTEEKLVKKPYKILGGPATKLEIAIKALQTPSGIVA